MAHKVNNSIIIGVSKHNSILREATYTVCLSVPLTLPPNTYNIDCSGWVQGTNLVAL